MSEKNANWFKVSREVFFHELSDDKPWNKLSAWLYLVSMASHEMHSVVLRGHSHLVRRGQCAVALGDLAKKYGWEKAKVQRFLGYLVRKGMVMTSGDISCTVISLVNYEKWQGNCQPVRTPKADTICDTICDTIIDSPQQAKELVADTVCDTVADTLNKKGIQEGYTRKEITVLSTSSPVIQKKVVRNAPTIGFEYEDGTWIGIDERHRNVWHLAYPSADLDVELAKMAGYLIDNPQKKYSNYGAFIRNWLSRSTGEAPMKKRSLESIGKKNMEEW
jgi:hypothetical protein